MTATPAVFDKLRHELNAEFVNRHDEIDTIILAFATGTHVVMLGEPGTGKSALVDRTLARIDGAILFSTLIMRDAGTDAVFGPLSLKGLKEDKRVRAAGPWLQRAHFAFLDECFKGNGTLLNGTLKVQNEGMFEENGVLVKVPLVSMLGASNEMPDLAGDNLAAMWDRWHHRLVVEPVTAPEDLKRIATTVWDDNPDKALTLADLDTVRATAKQTPVSDEALDAVTGIVVKLRRDHGINVSNRKYMQSLKVSSAAAWLAGGDEVHPEHLGFLKHMLWDHPDQRRDVAKVVNEVAAPMLAELQDQWDLVGKLRDDLTATLQLDRADPAFSAGGVQAIDRAKRITLRVVEIETAAGGSGVSEIARIEAAVEKLNKDASMEVIGMSERGVEPLFPQARAGTLVRR